MLRHDISDEELDKLTANNFDTNMFWTCIGAVISGVTPVIEKTHAAFWADNPIPFDIVSVIQISIFAICLAFSVHLGWSEMKNSKDRQRI